MHMANGFTWNCYNRIVRLKPGIGSSITNIADGWSFVVQQQLTEFNAVYRWSQDPVLRFQWASKTTA